MLCTIEKHWLIFSSCFVKVDVCPSTARGLGIGTFTRHHGAVFWGRAFYSELNVDNWNDNCEAKSEGLLAVNESETLNRSFTIILPVHQPYSIMSHITYIYIMQADLQTA